jgi:hypothetical protein
MPLMLDAAPIKQAASSEAICAAARTRASTTCTRMGRTPYQFTLMTIRMSHLFAVPLISIKRGFWEPAQGSETSPQAKYFI